MRYNKPVLTIDEQIDLLRARGLKIKDSDRAKKYLTTVGYFRLTGYMFHLQANDGSHAFLRDTEFDEIITLYQFDKSLRNLLSEYIERIEVAMRSLLSNEFSYKYGFFWYADHNLYADKNVHEIIIKHIGESFSKASELYLRSFQRKYTSESYPPSNMAMEILTFGKIARLYAGLNNDTEKQNIAMSFVLPSHILSSWITYIANVRNICAHHSRLWNKKVTVDRFKIPAREKYKFQGSIPDDFNTTVYGIISIINRLLSSINPGNTFISKIETLINSFPEIDVIDMGFPDDWENNATWKYPDG
ncbi:Abi family protein [Albibacterium profundi]|uniref:Abi family protein n=1 Tax=Albibacterium profundi TaxID=3134906 RepID=A0ABV5CFP4_9SPHI